jgi:hypothetical protein
MDWPLVTALTGWEEDTAGALNVKDARPAVEVSTVTYISMSSKDTADAAELKKQDSVVELDHAVVEHATPACAAVGVWSAASNCSPSTVMYVPRVSGAFSGREFVTDS